MVAPIVEVEVVEVEAVTVALGVEAEVETLSIWCLG